MTYELTTEEASSYEQDGYLVRECVFTAQEVVRFQQASERAVSRAQARCGEGRTYILDGKRFVDVDHVTVQFEHEPGSTAVRVIEPVHELDPELDSLVDDPRLVEPMRDLVGSPQIALWTDKLNLKRPQEGSAFPWHQDSPYWIHDCDHVDRLPNVMVAFDDATVDNGCFRIIRGSHRRGCLTGIADGSKLGGFYTDPSHIDELAQVTFEVPQGTAIFFHPHAVHGSLPNRSTQPRRAMIVTYQPAGFPTLKSGDLRNVGLAAGHEAVLQP